MILFWDPSFQLSWAFSHGTRSNQSKELKANDETPFADCIPSLNTVFELSILLNETTPSSCQNSISTNTSKDNTDSNNGYRRDLCVELANDSSLMVFIIKEDIESKKYENCVQNKKLESNVNITINRISVLFGDLSWQKLETNEIKSQINEDSSQVSFFDSDIPPKIKVHSGYHSLLFDNKTSLVIDSTNISKTHLADTIQNRIEELLGDDKSSSKEVVFAGYSQGGALAQIMSAYFAYEKPDIYTRLITFSSPYVGDDEFKTWSNSLLNLSSWRIVLFKDIIPRLSYDDDNNVYEHAGHLIQYSKVGSLFDINAYYLQEGNTVYKGIGKKWGDDSHPYQIYLLDDYTFYLNQTSEREDLWMNEFELNHMFPDFMFIILINLAFMTLVCLIFDITFMFRHKCCFLCRNIFIRI